MYSIVKTDMIQVRSHSIKSYTSKVLCDSEVTLRRECDDVAFCLFL